MKTKNVTEKNMKVCLVGSSGGHLTHLYMLKPFWKDKNRFWVTFDHRYLSRTQPQNRKVENAPHDFCRRWVDDKSIRENEEKHMITGEVEAVDRKQKIRDRYKGVDISELEVIPAKIIEDLETSSVIRRVAAYGIGSHDLRGFWVGQENVLSADRKSFSTAATCFV